MIKGKRFLYLQSNFSSFRQPQYVHFFESQDRSRQSNFANESIICIQSWSSLVFDNAQPQQAFFYDLMVPVLYFKTLEIRIILNKSNVHCMYHILHNSNHCFTRTDVCLNVSWGGWISLLGYTIVVHSPIVSRDFHQEAINLSPFRCCHFCSYFFSIYSVLSFELRHEISLF